MKLLRRKIGAFQGLALAGILGAMSAGQHAQAVFVFSILDSDTFTITALGSSLDGRTGYMWGGEVLTPWTNAWIADGEWHSVPILYTPGAGVPSDTDGTFGFGVDTIQMYYLNHSAGPSLVGLRIANSNFGSGSYTLPDSGVFTITNFNAVDLTTLVLPTTPVTMSSGVEDATGADNRLIFNYVPEPSVVSESVPEPSSALCLAVGGCTLLLRRKRA